MSTDEFDAIWEEVESIQHSGNSPEHNNNSSSSESNVNTNQGDTTGSSPLRRVPTPDQSPSSGGGNSNGSASPSTPAATTSDVVVSNLVTIVPVKPSSPHSPPSSPVNRLTKSFDLDVAVPRTDSYEGDSDDDTTNPTSNSSFAAAAAAAAAATTMEEGTVALNNNTVISNPEDQSTSSFESPVSNMVKSKKRRGSRVRFVEETDVQEFEVISKQEELAELLREKEEESSSSSSNGNSGNRRNSEQKDEIDLLQQQYPIYLSNDVSPIQQVQAVPQEADFPEPSSLPTADTEPADSHSVPSTSDGLVVVENKNRVLYRGLEEETAAWDRIEELQRTEPKQSGGVVKEGVRSPILFKEAVEQFQKRDLSRYQSSITVETIPEGTCSACCYSLFGPTTLSSETLKSDRDLIFLIAKVPLNHTDEFLERIMQTIYMKLTRTDRWAPFTGSHWELIGFQGSDPTTDLRGVGMLGPLQLLYLCMTYWDVSLEMYKLSKDSIQNFPFCVSSLNVTRIILKQLRNGLFNKEINEKKDVFVVVMECYTAAYHCLYLIWKREHKTVEDFGQVLQTVEERISKNYRAVVQEFHKWRQEKTAQFKVSEFQHDFTNAEK